MEISNNDMDPNSNKFIIKYDDYNNPNQILKTVIDMLVKIGIIEVNQMSDSTDISGSNGPIAPSGPIPSGYSDVRPIVANPNGEIQLLPSAQFKQPTGVYVQPPSGQPSEQPSRVYYQPTGVYAGGTPRSGQVNHSDYVIKRVATGDVDFDRFMKEITDKMNGNSTGGSLEKHINKSRNVLSLKKEDISKWLQQPVINLH